MHANAAGCIATTLLRSAAQMKMMGAVILVDATTQDYWWMRLQRHLLTALIHSEQPLQFAHSYSLLLRLQDDLFTSYAIIQWHVHGRTNLEMMHHSPS
jgi:hypothetical protein